MSGGYHVATEERRNLDALAIPHGYHEIGMDELDAIRSRVEQGGTQTYIFATAQCPVWASATFATAETTKSDNGKPDSGELQLQVKEVTLSMIELALYEIAGSSGIRVCVPDTFKL